ncbi:MAG: GIY-YIG nuclease family protein [bacterium]|nr:GIY-YIG nuclease family protein [bacterium]
MLYYVYILKCADKSLYAGCTNNLEKRLQEHNKSKRGAHYTKIRRPVKLVYSESFRTLGKARKREAEIKNWNRKEKLALIKK